MKPDITKPGYYKFVVVNGEYRFHDVETNFNHNHSDMVKEGEVAEAAGSFFVFEDSWRMEDSYSMTLKIGCGETEYIALGRRIGIDKEYRSSY